MATNKNFEVKNGLTIAGTERISSAGAFTGSLASATTATTQSATDNSTKIATTAYTDAAITAVIGGAPGTLDTLNELAAAINDDASYASTLTTALATKLPLAGGTMTGAINDLTLAASGISGNSSNNFVLNTPHSLRINIDSDNNATDQNFIIGHNQAGIDTNNVLMTVLESGNVGIGTSSPTSPLHVTKSKNDGFLAQLINTGTGSDANGLDIHAGVDTADYILRCRHQDGTDVMSVKYGGSVGIGTNSPLTKFHVHNGSDAENILIVTGADTTTEYIALGTSGGVGVLKSGNSSSATDGNPLAFETAASNGAETERMRIDGSGRVLIGIQSSTTPEEGGTNAGLEVVGESSGRFNALRLSNKYTVSTGTASTGILFGAHTSGGRDNALIEVQNTANGGDAIELQFHVRDNANSLRKCQVFNWQGNIHSQPDSANVQHYYGNQGGFMGGNSSHNIRAAGTLFMLNAGGGSSQIVLEINGANRGSVSSSSSSGVFSDRDMKENIQDIEIGLSEVLQLRPRKFKYKSGAHETYGFIAQEVETTIPLAVDEIELPEADVEANKTTLKTLDTTSLIASLVKSIQELEARITELEG